MPPLNTNFSFHGLLILLFVFNRMRAKISMENALIVLKGVLKNLCLRKRIDVQNKKKLKIKKKFNKYLLVSNIVSNDY